MDEILEQKHLLYRSWGNGMKRSIRISLVFLLVLALGGCSKGAANQEIEDVDVFTDKEHEIKQDAVTELGSETETETESEIKSEKESKGDDIDEKTTDEENTMQTKKVRIEELIITGDAKTIYGQIFMPEEEGRYPAVILSHGYNGSYSDFTKECEYFANNGFVAYAYDFCGSSARSKSSGATEDMTLFTEKDDLLTVFEYISAMDSVNSKQIFLLGASQGGMISTLVAEELKEKVAGMTLYYPALCIPDDWRVKYPSIDNVPETINFWGVNLGRDFVTSIHDLYVFDTIGNYTGNVLIIYGKNDSVVALEYAEKASSSYENVELIVLEDEGHGFSQEGGKYAMEKSFSFMNENRGRIYPDNPFQSIPLEYGNECENAGSIVSFSYETLNHRVENSETYTKEALVYLPHGYDPDDTETKYNILYLMHGGSDSPSWFFKGVGESSTLKKNIDNLINEGKMKPLIICAVSYYTDYSNDATANCKYFYLELMKDLIPVFENEFNTYAADTSDEGLKNSRSHRAFGGFSMGAMTTWSVFENCMDSFKYFMPISGDCWALGGTKGGKYADITANYLAKKVSEAGWTADDFIIYSGCGERDVAEPNLTPQINSMKKLSDIFIYTDNFADGNLYQLICKSGGHDKNTVRKVMYNGLPKMFD